MSRKTTFAELGIGPDHEPFIIAEMSGNHNGSLERALEIVDAVAATGAQAVKLQTYTAETMTLDINEGDFRIEDPESLWHGYSLYDLYEKAHTPWEWHKEIFDRARKRGMLCFSSPFDATAVDFLEELDAPLYKIASFECVDIPLIRKVAATGKPMIISTGMATPDDIELAVRTAKESGAGDVMILKCTSSYPATPENSNLRTIPNMRDAFGVQVGLSDHTLGIGAAVAAVAFGARAIEKHVTLKREEGGVDADFSLEPEELKALVDETRRAWQALGKVHYGRTGSEEGSRAFRRSLYICKSLQAGDVLDETNLRAIRPGFGLEPKYYDMLLGKRVNQDVQRGTPMSWELIG